MKASLFRFVSEHEEASSSGMWQVLALMGALSVGALALTWRRKSNRSSATTHWCVLLSAHGGLAALLHVFAAYLHLGGALVIVAMAERVIWEVSDGVAARIDSFVERFFDDAAPDDEDDPDEGDSKAAGSERVS